MIVSFSPFITHKLTVSSFWLGPPQRFTQQVYFPASVRWTDAICMNLLVISTSVSDLPSDSWLVLLVSKIHCRSENSSEHVWVKLLPAVMKNVFWVSFRISVKKRGKKLLWENERTEWPLILYLDLWKSAQTFVHSNGVLCAAHIVFTSFTPVDALIPLGEMINDQGAIMCYIYSATRGIIATYSTPVFKVQLDFLSLSKLVVKPFKRVWVKSGWLTRYHSSASWPEMKICAC